MLPSGGARNTLPLPVEPAAPGRFSMMTGWPQRSRNFSATMRGSASAEPPGGHGTTKVTARDGNLASCAIAANDASSARIAARANLRLCDTKLLLRLDAGFLDHLAP